MCDYFWQRMENDQGDLADIVRASGRGAPSTAELPIDDWQLPAEPMSFPAPPDAPHEEFGDPFANLRDPLLHELPSATFFDAPDVAARPDPVGAAGEHGAGGLLGPKVIGEEMKRPCNIFSRVLQISPGAAKASPLSPRAIRPSPIIAGAAGCAIDNSGVQISSPRTSGIKRRKSQAKKVVCIPAPAAATSRASGEVVPSDLWAWRKYGQKPIKGSPYPRGYYRCSSSKGCSARKQVERSRTDPNMLVITYTSEHNHPWPTQRNALAGSTRSQPPKNNSSASKNSPHSQKPATNLKEEQKETTTSSSMIPLVKEEAGEMEKPIDAGGDDNEFNQVFHQSYKPIIPDSGHPDDFFADLAELESDPMNLIFSRGMLGDKPDEERESKDLDPLNYFDWYGNSFGEAKKGL